EDRISSFSSKLHFLYFISQMYYLKFKISLRFIKGLKYVAAYKMIYPKLAALAKIENNKIIIENNFQF
ncbi:hypothetical protein LIS90_12975, partial [Flavobacterium psychrophilum]